MSLAPFFTPKSVAIIGASRNPHKLGFGVIRNLLEYKFKGNIYPVTLSANEILGVPCYGSLEEPPEPPDLAVLIVSADQVPATMKACGEASIRNVILVSGGFSETGNQGVLLEREVKKIAEQYNIRVIGPNCIGTIDTHTPVNTTFVVGMPEQGEIGFISQSGAMVAAVIDWARGAGVGFSRIVSLGNQMDVTENEMIRLIGTDRQTKVITAYAEGISNGTIFLKEASEIARKKPFIILKGGQSAKGAEAVSSHTGALSGSREAYSAAFKKAGVLEAATMEEMFDWARALAWQPLPKGKRVAVLTNAGGPAILAVDALEKAGLEIAELSHETRKYLKERLPGAASANNPVDILAGSGPATYTLALEALLTDTNVDAVVVIQAPQDWFLPASLAEVVGEAAGLHDKPVIASIMGKASVAEALNILHKRKVPNVAFPERAASILSAMVRRKNWLHSNIDHETHESQISERANAFVQKKDWKSLLKEYGIVMPPEHLCKTEQEAVTQAENIGFPVAMKLISEKHSHKSDIGGVLLNLENADDVRKAWTKLSDIGEHIARDFEGVSVQKMLKGGQEVIIGIRRDDQFGPTIVFGSGGTEVELYRDVATALAPLHPHEAEELINATIAGKKLYGWRNLPPADRPAVRQALLAMGQLAAHHPEIQELEINPLFVMENGKGAWAIDVRGSI